ncbi:MAG TPA: hypothetical protein DCR94_03390, partial [Firmicutes bacterium]|nr:hypothetical protein [Bacillota bacterium]
MSFYKQNNFLYSRIKDVKEIIPEQKYFELLKFLGTKVELDYSFLYSTYCFALSGLDEMKDDNPIVSSMGVNQVLLTIYLINEHSFYLRTHKQSNLSNLIKDEEYKQFIASI